MPRRKRIPESLRLDILSIAEVVHDRAVNSDPFTQIEMLQLEKMLINAAEGRGSLHGFGVWKDKDEPVSH